MKLRTRTALILVFTLSGIGCSQNLPAPEYSQIVGLGSPIQLGFDETTVIFEDFFKEASSIDKLSIPEGLTGIRDSETQVDLRGQMRKPLGIFTVSIDGVNYDLLLKKSVKQQVEFVFDPQGVDYKLVQMKGEMNAWNPNSTVLEKDGDVWKTSMLINEGIYQYLFVADGKEIQDPANPETISNGMGGFNSLLRVGNSRAEKPHLQTVNYDNDTILLKATNATEIIAFWQNHNIEVSTIGDEFSIKVPAAAQEYDRSYIRIWAHDGTAISNEVLIPLQNGFIVDNSDDLTRHDFHTWNMYFVLIDRFKDGNIANTRKVNDPDVHPKVNFYGGDFAGITQKIREGYFEQIGINTLWLSPISQNPEGAYGYWDQGGPVTKFSGYHGYWPISSSKTDNRFGTAEEFKELLNTAHENGMNVILDYVANHVHEEHPVYKNNPDWATDLYLPDGTMNTQLWDEQRLTTWFDTFLPTLDFSNPVVVEAMTDSALYWVTEFELDGFRHDATKHIQLEFWRTLTRKIKENVSYQSGRKLYQIGETYGSRELIASYINSGMLDSQFDFGMFDAAQNAFGQNTSFTGLRDQLLESFNYYGNHNLMGYISGNHDKARFITLTSGEVRWNEDAKVAGWTREIGYPKADAYKRLQMLHAWNMTIPGIPVTYQGDEFGQPGANDPDNRRWMQFEEKELRANELQNREVFSKLTALRSSNLPLNYGDFMFHHTDDHTLAYSRRYFGDLVMVVFNKSAEETKLTLPLREGMNLKLLQANFGNTFSVNGNEISITLPANTFEILTQ